MKKPIKKPSKVSKSPPKGWPEIKTFKKLEKKLNGHLPIQLFSDDFDPVQRAKHHLCAHFIIYFQEEKITQRELAKRLEVTESRVSEILATIIISLRLIGS